MYPDAANYRSIVSKLLLDYPLLPSSLRAKQWSTVCQQDYMTRVVKLPVVTRLDNGIRLIVHRLPSLNVVSINIRIDAGTFREQQHQGGLAHLVEHVLFRGTTQQPSNYALTAPIESLGGELDGATHVEYTSFWLSTPKAHFTTALPAFLDILRNPLLDPRDITSEKEVILSEIAELTEQGEDFARLQLNAALWSNHPLGRLVLGSQESLIAIQPEDVTKFFVHHYKPENMVASVVGDVDPQEITAALGVGWDTRNSKADTVDTLDTLDAAPGLDMSRHLIKCNRRGGLVHIILAFKIPPLNHHDFPACVVLSTLLGEGMSSRLYLALRGKSSLCYSLDTDIDELRHGCVLSFYMCTSDASVVTALGRMCQVFRGVSMGTTISQDDLEQCRGQAVGRLLMQSDQTGFHARMLAVSTFLTSKLLSVENHIEQIASVQLSDLRQVAGNVLQPLNLYGSLVGPIRRETWRQCRDIAGGWGS